MKRPVLFAFMVLCAVFWTAMGILSFFTQPKADDSLPHKKEIILRTHRAENQATALGLMVVSWIGVGVLWMTQRTHSTEAK